MANPFKQFLPDEELPKKEIEEQVMSSVHIKSHLAGILEFFFAIMGITLRDSIAVVPENENLSENKEGNDPDYFF